MYNAVSTYLQSVDPTIIGKMPLMDEAIEALQKSIDEMSEDELIERNKMITAGQTAKSVRDNSKPMPSFDQELGMHQSNTNSNPQLSNMMTILRTATRV